MRVLVTGATGFVGQRLVAALLAETAHDVTVLVRDAASYEPPDGVTVVEGDVLEPGSFEAALADADVAYYLIHAMGASGDFAERDRRAARNFERAASDAGVERVIYLSGLGSEGDALSSHLASRREVETLLRAGSADVTVLRAAIIIGDGSASFRLVRQLATRLPVMVTPQWVDTDSQPIAIDDVIAYCLAVLERPETAGETYEIGGPDVLTYREMLLATAEIATGRRPMIISVPVLSPRLSAHWVGLVTDVPREVAYPLIEGVRNRVVVTDDRLERLVDLELTPFDVAVRRAVGLESGDAERSVQAETAAPTERGGK
ncbi:NAD-dependent epimerase/dehydratase family protein [Haloterrigena sp. H1]|uniref:NAD(P)H-binding protein n=1 Tax=Haloterrigena sp. H1 TaxID=2552943 RepID=UPI00110D3040|nr:NAD(P)H-binding protein [Haloterrigena sp. H1]TMT85230.1 NAD-dependent epimerase/dehydratase family protein [Haloterrigena sp. H1]